MQHKNYPNLISKIIRISNIIIISKMSKISNVKISKMKRRHGVNPQAAASNGKRIRTDSFKIWRIMPDWSVQQPGNG